MKKRIVILFILLACFMGMQTISAQSGSFMSKGFTKELISGVKNLMKSNQLVDVEIDEITKASSDKKINGIPAVFEAYVKIKTNIANFFDDGIYLSGLYIDSSGMYDIANGSFFDVKHYLKEAPMERFLIEGSYKGKFYIILTLSNEIPYFGDYLNESFNSDDNLGYRYVNHALEEIKKVKASVFYFELDSSKL